MENQYNMNINPLPALTWNRLKMNEGAVEVLKAQTGAEIAVSELPEGVSLKMLSGKEEGIEQESREIQDSGCEGLSTDISGENSSWQEIETAMGADFERHMDDSAVTLLETSSDTDIEKPVIITLNYKEEAPASDRIYVHAAAKSSLSVIFVLKSGADVQASLQIKTKAEQEACVSLYVVQLTGENSVVLTDVSSVCEEKAEVTLTKLELGGGVQYVGVCTTLKGNKSRFHAEAGYRVRKGQRLDMNYLVRHVGKKTLSEMNASGVLEEDAFKLFRGTIDFPRGCAGAKGNEKEDILLLGERQVNQTIPLILCKEEDVEGNHGATIGRLPEQVLFYLGTRGISSEAAEDLIASAKLEAVCGLIPDEKVKQTVRAFLCAMTRDRICG